MQGGNAVWRRYIVQQMPDWLRWLKSVHLPSHLRIWSKYTKNFTPEEAYGILRKPTSESERQDTEMLESLFHPPDRFWLDLESEVGPEKAARMYRVALSLTIEDFLHDLFAYAQQFPEVRQIYTFIHLNQAWFDKLLDFIRSELYSAWHQQGKV